MTLSSCPVTGSRIHTGAESPRPAGLGRVGRGSNEYSAERPQQMEAALLELEILNSRAQDTSSQLMFLLLLPWKEPEPEPAPAQNLHGTEKNRTPACPGTG